MDASGKGKARQKKRKLRRALPLPKSDEEVIDLTGGKEHMNKEPATNKMAKPPSSLQKMVSKEAKKRPKNKKKVFNRLVLLITKCFRFPNKVHSFNVSM